MTTDPFVVLGLAPGAAPEEVRRAYRRLAMRWHPDRNAHSREAEERFKAIKAAYETAADPAAYRAWQAAARARAQEAARGRTRRTGGAAHADDAAEAPHAGGAAEASDAEDAGTTIEQALPLTLEEAAQGGRRTVRVARVTPCASCAGRGRIAQAHSSPCRHCGGVGRRRGQDAAANEKCAACNGRGYVRYRDCDVCSGAGRTVAESVFEVTVPAGLRDGEVLRLSPDDGAVLLRVALQPHSLFSLRGNDLVCPVPVDLLHWIAGGEIEVPTLSGVLRVTLPPPALSAELRIAGQGFPGRGAPRGDLLLQLSPLLPSGLTTAEATQLRHLAAVLRERMPAWRAWQEQVAQRERQRKG